MFFPLGQLLLSFGIPWILGLSIVLYLSRDEQLSSVEYLAFSYGIGWGCLTNWMLLLGTLRIPLHLENIILPMILFILIFLFLNRKRPQTKNLNQYQVSVDESTQLRNKPFLALGLFLMALYIACQMYWIFWQSVNLPIRSWDAFYFIALKAKLFFFDRALDLTKNLPWNYPAHGESYPIHVTLSETWIALNLGQWLEPCIKLIFPVTCSVYLLLQYRFIKLHSNMAWALFGIVLILSSNLFTHHASISYSDLTMLFYNSTTLILLVLWLGRQKNCYLLLAGLFSGMGTFVKLEASGYAALHVLLVLGLLFANKDIPLRRKFQNFLRFVIPVLIIFSNFSFYKYLNHIPAMSRLFFDIGLADFHRLSLMLKNFGYNLFFSGNWNILWFLFILSLILRYPQWKNYAPAKFLIAALVLFFMSYFCLALFTHNFRWVAGEQSYISLSRLILHFFPISIWLIVLLNFNKTREL